MSDAKKNPQLSEDDEVTMDKTSVVSSDTFRGRMEAADSAPPTLIALIAPQGYVGRQWPLNEPDMTIGRSVDSHIFIDDKSISKTHAKVSVVGSDVSIMDLGSTNKTIVNGAPQVALTPYKLKNNDQIKTGNVIFKFLERGNIEAISTKAIYEKAAKDALTGAFSRGALVEKGPEAVKRAEVLSEPMSMLVFDIDFFKKTNDNYGHLAGDFILKELSRVVMEKVVRSHDFFARYGGEEFVIILSGSRLDSAMEVAERLRQTIEAHAFIFEGTQIPVTISVGVGELILGSEKFDQLFKRADEALYKSKRNGRNQVTA